MSFILKLVSFPEPMSPRPMPGETQEKREEKATIPGWGCGRVGRVPVWDTRVTGSVLREGSSLGGAPGPQGAAWEATTHASVCPSPRPPLPLPTGRCALWERRESETRFTSYCPRDICLPRDGCSRAPKWFLLGQGTTCASPRGLGLALATPGKSVLSVSRGWFSAPATAQKG